MASLEQRKGNYRIVFRLGGTKFSRSLRTNDEKAAVGSLARLEDNLRRVELGTLTIPEDADIPSFLLSDGKLSTKVLITAPLTLGSLFQDYVDAVSTGHLEETTIGCVEIHRRHLEGHFGEAFAVQRISLDDLQSYVTNRAKAKGRRGRKLDGTTIRKEIATFRAVWNWGVDAGKLKGDFPKKGLRFPKQRELPPFQTWVEIERQIEQGGLSKAQQADLWDCLFLTLAEVDDVLKHVKEAARHPFIYPMFVMAAHTGARRSELLRSQLTDFNCDTVTIRERKRVRGKQSTRRVPLSQELRQVMDDWLKVHPGGNYTFCHQDSIARSRKNGKGSRPITCDEAHDHFKRPLSGSKWEKIKGWHCFRHSFCSNCAMKGIDQRIIDAWVGHTTEDMRRRYRHLFPSSEKQAMSLVFG